MFGCRQFPSEDSSPWTFDCKCFRASEILLLVRSSWSWVGWFGLRRRLREIKQRRLEVSRLVPVCFSWTSRRLPLPESEITSGGCKREHGKYTQPATFTFCNYSLTDCLFGLYPTAEQQQLPSLTLRHFESRIFLNRAHRRSFLVARQGTVPEPWLRRPSPTSQSASFCDNTAQ